MLSNSSNKQDSAEDAEENHFVGLMGYERAERVTIACGDEEDDEYGRASDADRDEDLLRTTTDEENCDQWKVDGHHEVFENEDREDGGCLGSVHALELSEEASDDAGGCDKRDAAKKDRCQRRPAEQHSGEEAGREVEEEIDCGTRDSLAEASGEVFAGILETEHEEQKENADLCSELNEVLGQVKREAARRCRKPVRR